MDKKTMNMLMMIAGWILVLAGLAWAYEGITNVDIIEQIFGGSLEPIIDIFFFGGSALFMGYFMLMKKK
jgi:uncharacterized membrane protein YuzA (DUF378 family)